MVKAWSDVEIENVRLDEALEVTSAKLAAAVDHVDRLEAIIARVGGYMSATDQATLHEARVFLIERGKRKPSERGTWRDRP